MEEDKTDIAKATGRTIRGFRIGPGYDWDMDIMFTDGSVLRISDRAQSCCEDRYMTCDADLPAFVGAVFTGAEVRSYDSEEHEYMEHEVAFLHIHTSLGSFVAESHNVHNGFYGGFAIRALFEEG